MQLSQRGQLLAVPEPAGYDGLAQAMHVEEAVKQGHRPVQPASMELDEGSNCFAPVLWADAPTHVARACSCACV